MPLLHLIAVVERYWYFTKEDTVKSPFAPLFPNVNLSILHSFFPCRPSHARQGGDDPLEVLAEERGVDPLGEVGRPLLRGAAPAPAAGKRDVWHRGA